MKQRRYQIIFIIFATLLFIDSLAEINFSFPDIFPLSPDKVKHILSAFLLIILFGKAFRNFPFFWAICILFMGGVVIEILQHFLSHEHHNGDLNDIYANGVGFVMGSITLQLKKTIKNRKEHKIFSLNTSK